MPAPTRSAPAKKAPAKKATAAVRARREVRAEKNAVQPIKVPFRGVTFEIPVDRLGAFYMRGQYIAHFGIDGEQMSKALFEVLGKVDSGRLLDLVRPGDALLSVMNEFMTALNKAGNVPNS